MNQRLRHGLSALLLVLALPILPATAQIADNPDASGVLGQADFVSRVSGLSASQLNGPNGVAVDPTTGKVFVADRGNNRVLRWSSAQALQSGSEAEAVFGQDDFTSRETGVAANRMNNPIGVHLDAEGRLWVADFSNNRVLRFDDASARESGAGADGVLGQPDFTTNASVLSRSGMRGPVTAFADHTGALWVSEFNSHRITRFDDAADKPNGAEADGVIGQPDFTSGSSGLSATALASPNGVYVDLEGRVWITDSGNRRVTRYDNAASGPDGPAADGVLGQPDFTTNAANITQSGMGSLRFVYGDSDGRLYVLQENSHRMTIYEDAASKPNGAPADYVWGQPDFTTGTAANPPTASSFNTPRAVFVDEARDHVWVADWSNHRVLRFELMRDSDTPTISLLAPNGGETFAFGTTRAIRWSSALVEEVALAYSTDDGETWVDIATVPATPGEYAWRVPETPTTTARVRITDTADPSVQAVSAAAFTIAEPDASVTLISPDGYQHWTAGATRRILFSTRDVTAVDLFYSLDDGASWMPIAAAHPTASGAYDWTLPDAATAQARVRIVSSADDEVADESRAAFTILAEPTGGPQDLIFFGDHTVGGFYDPSWAFANSPSTVENQGTKLPLSPAYAYGGNYSLRLSWTSAAGGDWGAAIASAGWVGRDVTTKDTLELRVFTETGLEQGELPVIYLEDLSNRRSPKVRLATLTGAFEANTWNHVRIPTEVFTSNAGTADMTRIKTIFLGQDAADGQPHTLYLDDIRLTGGEVISGDSSRVIVVLGSSTAAGTGATSADSSWVGRFRAYVRSEDPEAHVVNLAVGGYSSYDVMPTGFTPPAGRPTPKVNNNVTYALTYRPQAIIINLPSNDAAQGLSIAEQMSNLRTIVSEATAQGVKVWITTTQPRNFAEDARRQNLMAVRDSILAQFTPRTVDVWTGLAEPDGRLQSRFDSGDGIHLNNAGHRLLFERMQEAEIWAALTTSAPTGAEVQRIELGQNYPNPLHGATHIRFSLPTFTARVSVEVFDVLGRRVATLLDQPLEAGEHTLRFDASALSSGVYLYRLDAGGQVLVRNMTVLR